MKYQEVFGMVKQESLKKEATVKKLAALLCKYKKEAAKAPVKNTASE